MNTINKARLKAGSGQILTTPERTMPRPVNQIGFWSAVFATVFSIGYGIAVIIMVVTTITATERPSGLTGLDLIVATFQPVQMLPLIPSLLLVPAFVTLMVSIHYYASPEKRSGVTWELHSH